MAEDTPERQAFYSKIRDKNLDALWTVLADLVTPEPKSNCRPAVWHFKEIRDAMMEAGGLITAKEAERRVLLLENPGFKGESKITTALFAGVQMVMPGEIAPSHRHSQSALRFILEGQGATTSVDGEKTVMNVGDFVITPANTWHDHANETAEPMFWLDGLDIPIVKALDASFMEHYPEDTQPISRPVGDSPMRYGNNLMPVDHKPAGRTSPVFNYPYARTREVLETLKKNSEPDPCHGFKMKFTNPETGGHAMPTIGTFIQLLPKGTTTSRYRSSDATVFTCIEGRGRTRVGDGIVLEWGPQDVWVVPSWMPASHEADDESTVFSFSDRPVQEVLGLWREDRFNN
ncbi:MAG: hypothetical protein RLZ98_1457 [Pseudomonadota bacterium]|jgi:gentisate 1,2-dioxygenase